MLFSFRKKSIVSSDRPRTSFKYLLPLSKLVSYFSNKYLNGSLVTSCTIASSKMASIKDNLLAYFK